jgi:hypothetical protein
MARQARERESEREGSKKKGARDIGAKTAIDSEFSQKEIEV